MSQKIYFIAINFFSNNLTSELGVFNIFKADKINIKCTLHTLPRNDLLSHLYWGTQWTIKISSNE